MADNDELSITSLVDEYLAAQRAEHARSEGRLTFTASVQAFIAVSDWLGPEHMPSVVALVELADKLDTELTAAMAAQFGLTFRDLRSQAPSSPAGGDDDPVAAALRAAGKL